MSDLTNIKQGEQKNLILTVKDAQGQLVDLSTATLFLGFKAKKTDTSYAIEKSDLAFVKTNAASGEVAVKLTSTDTATAGKLIGELKVTFDPGESTETIEKSVDFYLYIEQAVTT